MLLHILAVFAINVSNKCYCCLMHTWAHTETYTRIFFDIFLETSSPVSMFIFRV